MAACQRCGKTMASDNPRALYCGGNCRANAAKDRAKGVDADSVAARRLAAAPAADHGPVYIAALAELEAADRAQTALGQAALALAARIDLGRDTGAALAAAAKQMQATLSSATAGAATRTLSRVEQARERANAKRYA